jgi:hypothetical protein
LNRGTIPADPIALGQDSLKSAGQNLVIAFAALQSRHATYVQQNRFPGEKMVGKHGESDSGHARDSDSASPTGDPIKLFISYSHDSDAHKEWVRELAERLEKDGVDITFDQQDLRIAMSASSFMEDSLQECDRVLLIITEPYVTKSNNLVGGVGYERMIITAEIAKDLRTTRFIPLVRSGDKVPAFVGDRIRVDARYDEKWEAEYASLLAELRRPMAPRKGQDGEREKDGRDRAARKGSADEAPAHPETYHWNHDVHSYVGNRLYLIFVKFVKTGAKARQSIVKDIEDAGISDYTTYELYASHDLLIRAWADQEAYYVLKTNVERNNEVDDRHTELMEANGVHHFPDSGTIISDEEIREIVETLDADAINNIQTGLDDSAIEDKLIEKGIRISDKVRFNGARIQFYIIVRALRHERSLIDKFEEKISTFPHIFSKTIYHTRGNASEAVIKGQVDYDDYYTINDFVNAVADALYHGDVRTETALVAHEGPKGDGWINARTAERYLIEKKYRELIGNGRGLSPTEDMKLLARFAEAAHAMVEDRKGVLREMIRLRAQGNLDNFDHIRTFFADFENMLRKHVNSVILQIFGPQFEEGKRQLFVLEDIANANKRGLVLGDLTKVYRRIIENHGIIILDPLTEDEFKALMSEAVEVRNKLAHGVPELTFWANTFQFFQRFVRIEARLHRYLESIQ